MELMLKYLKLVKEDDLSRFFLNSKCTIDGLLLAETGIVDMLNVSVSVYRYQN